MISVKATHSIKTGGCPHGLPSGACPICNGSSGGSSSSVRRNPGEMSWDECYSVGLILKAIRQNAEANKNIYENHLFQNSIMNKIALIAAENVSKLKNFFLQIPAVQVLSNVTGKLTNAVKQTINTILTSVTNFVSFIPRAINMLKAELINISDKLTAIWGEKENILRKFISDNLEIAKKKIFGFFNFIEETAEQSEHSDEVEKQKRRLFNLDKFKSKVSQIFKKVKEKK
ncbi:MAG: hypothetical protein WC197_03210 [Candidatus Gastranaerophilaceae bacterium]|jgi:hypothetical protein